MSLSSRWFVATGLASCALVGPAVALAQSDADVKLLEKARALYFSGPAPKSMACDATIDWDDFFKSLNQPQTDQAKARVEKLEQLKISVVTRGAADTNVNVSGPDAPANLTSGIQMQLRGFFQMYWSEAYGDLIAKKGDPVELTTTGEGYVENTTAGAMKVSVTMNKSFLVTEVNVQSPQLSAITKPSFEPGADGLLRLRKVDQITEMGTSKLAVIIAFDYQKVGSYDFPQHLEMSLPGSYTFHYTLSGCKADSDLAPVATSK